MVFTEPKRDTGSIVKIHGRNSHTMVDVPWLSITRRDVVLPSPPAGTIGQYVPGKYPPVVAGTCSAQFSPGVCYQPRAFIRSIDQAARWGPRGLSPPSSRRVNRNMHAETARRPECERWIARALGEGETLPRNGTAEPLEINKGLKSNVEPK